MAAGCSNRFGARIREIRLESGRTLGQVARELGISVSYLSDIERGYRNPFGDEQIQALAAYLAVDATDELLRLATADRGRLELMTTDAGPSKAELAGALQRRWDDMTEEEAERILDQMR